jgi:hypothetical protein
MAQKASISFNSKEDKPERHIQEAEQELQKYISDKAPD